MAAAEIERRRRLRQGGLLQFVPRISKRFAPPIHLSPLVELLERARQDPIRVVVSTPPRHGKTETLLHYIAWQLARAPETQIAYISYAQRFAEKKSRKARELSRSASVRLADDSQSRGDWRTGVDDGGLWATGIQGALTGEGFHVMIVDDPVKDRATAESAISRDNAWDWFTDTAYSRLEPNGSCIVNMARWHEDDLAGRLVKEGWQELTLPAIDDAGHALWPERWPVDRLRDIESTLGPYGWSSLYQGRPRPRGGSVFRDVHFYDELPKSYRVAIGIDLAYTSKTHSHWCVAVALAESDGKYYALDVRREQSDPPTFAAQLRTLKAAYPGARMLWYTSTTEKGLADLLREQSGFQLVGEIAAADKFVRAQPVASAWNRGNVLLPRGPKWVDTFVAEVCGFTGIGDRHDDQVDAFAAAYDMLVRGAGIATPRTFSNRFHSFGGTPFAPPPPAQDGDGGFKW